jgi:hypothetical protein
MVTIELTWTASSQIIPSKVLNPSKCLKIRRAFNSTSVLVILCVSCQISCPAVVCCIHTASDHWYIISALAANVLHLVLIDEPLMLTNNRECTLHVIVHSYDDPNDGTQALKLR